MGDPDEAEDLSGTARYDAVGRRYHLWHKLGSGGFGTVYRARIRTAGGLEQEAAVKLLNPHVEPAAQPVARLRDEAALLTRLNHPAILVAYDLVVLGDRLALVTEYIDGADLGRLIEQDGPLPLGPVVDVVSEVASALSAAWTDAGIVHRDVKPSNVLVGRHGNVKLLDFGIARSDLGEREAHTTAFGMLGSLWYVPPERFDPASPLAPAGDVFALGCVAYEALVGEPLFDGLDVVALHRLGRSAATFDRHVAAALARLPASVRPLVAAMLSHDPAARPTANDVTARCDALAGALGSSLRAWCRRRLWVTDKGPPEAAPSELLAAPLPEELDETVLRPPPVPQGGPTAPLAVLAPYAPPSASEVAPAPALSPPAALAPPPAAAPAPGTASRTAWVAGSVGLAAATTTTAATVVGTFAFLIGLGSIVAMGALEHADPGRGGPRLPVAAVDPVFEPPPPPPDAEPEPEPPTPPERPGSPAPAPRHVRVTFLGPVGGQVYFDGQALGETNASYEVPLGVHRCEVFLQGPGAADTCRITPKTRTVVLGLPTGLVVADSETGAAQLELRAGPNRFEPGRVPPGAYEVWADFGAGLVRAGSVKVGVDEERVVRCDAPVATCFAR